MVRNFLVCNFSYLEIVDILQIKNMKVSCPSPHPTPLLYEGLDPPLRTNYYWM